MNDTQLSPTKMVFKSITNKHLSSRNTLTIIALVISLSACVSNNSTQQRQKSPHSSLPTHPQTQSSHQTNYLCKQPSQYLGKVIGDGQCVSLIKHCSLAPQTSFWKQGKQVLSLPAGSIKVGSIIATFKNGKYPSIRGYHAAVYIKHDKHGIWVWDQWVGKPVHKRLIRTRFDNASASNTAQAYYLVH